jgi:hypothetical protein
MYVPFLNLLRSSVFTGCEYKDVFDANSAVFQSQLVGDPHWTGVAPLAAFSIAATPDTTPDVSANASDLTVLY